MGCNCSKKKTPPAGSKKSTQGKPSGSTSTTLNTASGKTQKFSLTRPDGTTKSYGSKLEAMAEQARRGGQLRF